MRVRTALVVVALTLQGASTAFALSPPAQSSAPSVSPPFGRVLTLGPDGRTVPPRRPLPPHALPLREVPPEHATGQGAEEHEHAPGDVNWTDFGNKDQPPYLASLINFAILAFLYVYFGKKPIAHALVARRESVSKQIDEAQKIKHEAEARSKQYAAKLQDLSAEVEMTRVALASAGAGEKARIVREAEEKAVRMEKDAGFLLEQERLQVQQDLAREAILAAVTEAERLLRSKLTQADQERLAEEFLTTLTPVSPTERGGASARGVTS